MHKSQTAIPNRPDGHAPSFRSRDLVGGPLADNQAERTPLLQEHIAFGPGLPQDAERRVDQVPFLRLRHGSASKP